MEVQSEFEDSNFSVHELFKREGIAIKKVEAFGYNFDTEIKGIEVTTEEEFQRQAEKYKSFVPLGMPAADNENRLLTSEMDETDSHKILSELCRTSSPELTLVSGPIEPGRAKLDHTVLSSSPELVTDPIEPGRVKLEHPVTSSPEWPGRVKLEHPVTSSPEWPGRVKLEHPVTSSPKVSEPKRIKLDDSAPFPPLTSDDVQIIPSTSQEINLF